MISEFDHSPLIRTVLAIVLSCLLNGLALLSLAKIFKNPQQSTEKYSRVMSIHFSNSKKINRVTPKSMSRPVSKTSTLKKAVAKTPSLSNQPAQSQVSDNSLAMSESTEQNSNEDNPFDTAFDISDSEDSAIILQSSSPKYPLIAKKAGIECKLILELLINEFGYVQLSRVKYCSKTGLGFEESALESTKHLRFKPFIIKGYPVKIKIIYPIAYILNR